VIDTESKDAKDTDTKDDRYREQGILIIRRQGEIHSESCIETGCDRYREQGMLQIMLARCVLDLKLHRSSNTNMATTLASYSISYYI